MSVVAENVSRAKPCPRGKSTRGSSSNGIGIRPERWRGCGKQRVGIVDVVRLVALPGVHYSTAVIAGIADQAIGNIDGVISKIIAACKILALSLCHGH